MINSNRIRSIESALEWLALKMWFRFVVVDVERPVLGLGLSLSGRRLSVMLWVLPTLVLERLTRLRACRNHNCNSNFDQPERKWEHERGRPMLPIVAAAPQVYKSAQVCHKSTRVHKAQLVARRLVSGSSARESAQDL